MYPVNKGFRLLFILLVEDIIGVKHDVLHFVFVINRDILATWHEVHSDVLSQDIVCVAHVQTKVLNITIIILYVHQIVINLFVDCFQIINLIALFYELIQECFRESALE